MYVEVNGKQVFATTGGKPFDNGKPVVVFLHGSGFDHTTWNLQSRFFAFRNYSVLALDLPGHTNSEGPPLASIEDMAEWLDGVFESLDIDNPQARSGLRICTTLALGSDHCWPQGRVS